MNDITAPLESTAYTIGGTFLTDCNKDYPVSLIAQVKKTFNNDPDHPQKWPVELKSSTVSSGGSFSFTLDWCRDVATLMDFSKPHLYSQTATVSIQVVDPSYGHRLWSQPVDLTASNALDYTKTLLDSGPDLQVTQAVPHGGGGSFLVAGRPTVVRVYRQS